MIRNLLLGSVAASSLLVAALPAGAADLGIMPAPLPVVQAFSWTGFYIGGNAGGKWGSFTSDVFGSPVPGFAATSNGDFFHFDTHRDSSFLGGGQLGFNWQVGRWVLGVEGDVDATDVKRGFTLGTSPGGGIFIPGDSVNYKNDWQASLRARGGFAFDRFMIYATGGVAFAGVKAEGFYAPGFVGTIPVPAGAGSDSQTLVGGTVGGGIEYAFTNNISLGVEYRYSDFGHETFNLGVVPFPAGAGSLVTSDADLKTHEVTARLNIRFGSLFGPH